MSLSTIKTVVTSKAGRQILLGKKHSPHIMFGAGVVGIVGTVVLASKATLKLDEIVTENEALQKKAGDYVARESMDYTAKDYAKDMAQLKVRLVRDVGKVYLPAVGLGVVSIGLLTGSHVVLTKRNTAVMAAYATIDQSFKDYRRRVVDKYGKDIDNELSFETEQVAVHSKNEDGEDVVSSMRAITGHSRYARFFDQMCSPWQATPELNMIYLKAQQNYANDLLRSRGHVFLNEIYDMLDVPRTKEGAVVGWVKDSKHDNYVDFGIFDDSYSERRNFVNGREGAILLDFNVDGVIYDLI